MANLKTVVVTNTEYMKAEDVLGITLEVGTTYFLQSRNVTFICEKATKPNEDEGFLINENSNYPTYECNDGAFLWIKSTPQTSIFNIGD